MQPGIKLSSRVRLGQCSFRAVPPSERIQDKSGRDISSEYHPEFAYEMVRLTGKPIKVGEIEPELALRIKELFWDAGVRHMSDCSVFLDQAGELVNVIDFALQEYELEHEPL